MNTPLEETTTRVPRGSMSSISYLLFFIITLTAIIGCRSLQSEGRISRPATITQSAEFRAAYDAAQKLSQPGKYAQAEAAYRKLIQQQEREFERYEPSIMEIRVELAWVLYAGEKYEEAEEVYRVLLRQQTRELGLEHSDTLKTKLRLGNTLLRLFAADEAEVQYREVIKVRERVSGHEHPETLLARYNLGTALTEQKKPAEAEAELKAVLAIQERVLGPEHINTLDTLSNLAKCLYLHKLYGGLEEKLPEGREFAQRALAGRRKVLGANHPKTQEAEQLMETLRLSR